MSVRTGRLDRPRSKEYPPRYRTYSQSIRFHPATPEGRLFLRFRTGADDATGRNNRQRSSYITYESRGVCDVATRANGFDEAEVKGDVDGEDALGVQSMVPVVG